MNEQFCDQNLIELPEQRQNHSKIWGISKEFMQLIDCIPFYSGILFENGETVILDFARSSGYLPEIPVESYFKGSIYAKLLEKGNSLYVPKGMEKKVNELFQKTTEKILGEMNQCELISYDGTLADILKKLKEEDSEK